MFAHIVSVYSPPSFSAALRSVGLLHKEDPLVNEMIDVLREWGLELKKLASVWFFFLSPLAIVLHSWLNSSSQSGAPPYRLRTPQKANDMLG